MNWFLDAIGQAAEQEFIGANAKGYDGSEVVPTAAAAGKIDAAAIRDKARFNGGVWRAQRNRVITKGRVDIAERRQKLFEEFVAGAVGLGHRGQAPKVLFGGEDFGERLSGTRLACSTAERGGRRFFSLSSISGEGGGEEAVYSGFVRSFIERRGWRRRKCFGREQRRCGPGQEEQKAEEKLRSPRSKFEIPSSKWGPPLPGPLLPRERGRRQRP